MTLRQAIHRLEQELFPEFEASEMGHEKPISRELAVEMTALYIAIKEEWGRYFHYRIVNWFPRAVFFMGWSDSLAWWAQVGPAGFTSEYRDKHPMPADLEAAITAARELVKS